MSKPLLQITIQPSATLTLLGINIIAGRTVKPTRFVLPGNAISLNIAQMCTRRTEIASLEFDEPRFDDDTAIDRSMAVVKLLALPDTVATPNP